MSDVQIEEDLARARLDRRMAGRMASLLRPVAGHVALVVLVELVLAASVIARPWFLREVVDRGFVPDGSRWRVDQAVVLWAMLGLAAVWLVRFGLGGLGQWLSGTL